MEQIYFLYDPKNKEYIDQVISEEQPENSTTVVPGRDYIVDGKVVDGIYVNLQNPIFDVDKNIWIEQKTQPKVDETQQALGAIMKQLADLSEAQKQIVNTDKTELDLSSVNKQLDALTKQNEQLQEALGSLTLQLAKEDK